MHIVISALWEPAGRSRVLPGQGDTNEDTNMSKALAIWALTDHGRDYLFSKKCKRKPFHDLKQM